MACSDSVFCGGRLGIGDGKVREGFLLRWHPETGSQLRAEKQTKRFVPRTGGHGPLGGRVYVLAIPPSILYLCSYRYA